MQLWFVLSHISATNFTCTYIRIHVSLCVMLLHFHWHSWLLEFLMGHIIAPIMCSRVLCVMTFLLAFLAFGAPYVSYHSTHYVFTCVVCYNASTGTTGFRFLCVPYHSTQILFMCVVCHDVFTVTPGFRVPCGSHHITHMSVFLWSLLYFY